MEAEQVQDMHGIFSDPHGVISCSLFLLSGPGGKAFRIGGASGTD